MNFEFSAFNLNDVKLKSLLNTLHSENSVNSTISFFLLGHVSAGKTSLLSAIAKKDFINRKDAFNRNNTNGINLIRLSSKFNFWDFPGIGGEEVLEDLSRRVLHLPLKSLKFLDNEKISLTEYERGFKYEKKISFFDNLNLLELHPSYILYIISAKEGKLHNREQHFIKDLYQKYNNIVFIFNIHLNEEGLLITSTTEINNAKESLYKLLKKINISLENIIVCEIVCKNGFGLEKLFDKIQFLKNEKSWLVQVVNSYSKTTYIDKYNNFIYRELIAYSKFIFSISSEEIYSLDTITQTGWIFFRENTITSSVLTNAKFKKSNFKNIFKDINSIFTKKDVNSNIENINFLFSIHKIALSLTIFISSNIYDSSFEVNFTEIYHLIMDRLKKDIKFNSDKNSFDDFLSDIEIFIKRIVKQLHESNEQEMSQIRSNPCYIILFPYILNFISDRYFTISTNEVILNWHVDYADHVSLNSIPVSSFDNNYKQVLLLPSIFTLTASNSFHEVCKSISIDVFKLPEITNLSLPNLFLYSAELHFDFFPYTND